MDCIYEVHVMVLITNKQTPYVHSGELLTKCSQCVSDSPEPKFTCAHR